MTQRNGPSVADLDPMIARVVETMDATECAGCQKRPDLLFAWDAVSKTTILQDTAAAARLFAEHAVEHLKATGWRMEEDQIVCSQCQAARSAR